MRGMDIFATIFAVFMIAAAVAATILVGMFAGGIWGALAFAALLWCVYRAFTHQTGTDRPPRHDQLNAFQQPLADDEAVVDAAPVLSGGTAAPKTRAGYRNRGLRKHMKRRPQSR